MLAHRLRRRANINPALIQRLVFAGEMPYESYLILIINEGTVAFLFSWGKETPACS